MKFRTRALRGARKLHQASRAAGTNGRKSGELAVASSKVIARRTALAAAALVDPLHADPVEFARMIPEKTAAFSSAGMAWLGGAREAAARISAYATSELASAATAAVAIAGCKTPAGIMAAQSRFATAWFARAMSQSIALGSLALKSQGAAMAPIYRTATGNARRLSRSG